MKTKEKDTILFSFLIMANLLSGSIYEFIKVSNIFPGIILILLIISELNLKLKINKKIMVLLFILIIQFILSFLLVDSRMTRKFILDFMFIGIPSIIIANKKIYYFKVYSYIQLIYFICYPYIFKQLINNFTVYDSGKLMGIAYSILPVVLSNIGILKTKAYTINGKNIKLIVYMNFILTFFLILKLMSRGFFVCIFVYIFIIYIYEIKYNIKVIIKKLGSVFLFLILFKNKIEGLFIFKWVFLNKSKNFLNGRENDFQNIFSNNNITNIFLGNGIGSYYKNFGGSYTYIHNLFGMIYYEQGIFLLLIFVVIIFKTWLYFFKCKKRKGFFLIIALLFSSSIIRLMVSYYFWIDQLFWIYITIYFRKLGEKNEGKSFGYNPDL